MGLKLGIRNLTFEMHPFLEPLTADLRLHLPDEVGGTLQASHEAGDPGPGASVTEPGQCLHQNIVALAGHHGSHAQEHRGVSGVRSTGDGCRIRTRGSHPHPQARNSKRLHLSGRVGAGGDHAAAMGKRGRLPGPKELPALRGKPGFQEEGMVDQRDQAKSLGVARQGSGIRHSPHGQTIQENQGALREGLQDDAEVADRRLFLRSQVRVQVRRKGALHLVDLHLPRTGPEFPDHASVVEIATGALVQRPRNHEVKDQSSPS